MEPFLKDGDTILVMKYFFLKPKVGDTIIFNHTTFSEREKAKPTDQSLRKFTPPHIFAKRITKILDNKFWVEGDNKKLSYDSRKFGYINKKSILGKVICKI